MQCIFRHLDEAIDANYIINLGKIINKNINEISSFRTGSVFIKAAEHIPSAAADVPRLIQELLFTSFRSDDFVRDLSEFHIRYERIHPFGDGNGRTGRVLICKYALENGYPVIVVPKEQRGVYMNLLASCDVEGMRSFFSGLMENEMKRMAEFNIDVSKLALKPVEEMETMNSIRCKGR